jgi:NTP pyrophosphatase (non-canonical NTP hydrolase)
MNATETQSGSSLDPLGSGLPAVLAERKRQDAKWGVQNHRPELWLVILMEEVGEASEATLEMDWNAYREEMVQVAAVALAAVESCDRAGVPPNDKAHARREQPET